MQIKVLVIDNNPVHVHAVRSFLQKNGCDVTIAVNALEAIKKIQENRPDMLITDVAMPLVDGEKLCK